VFFLNVNPRFVKPCSINLALHCEAESAPNGRVDLEDSDWKRFRHTWSAGVLRWQLFDRHVLRISITRKVGTLSRGLASMPPVYFESLDRTPTPRSTIWWAPALRCKVPGLISQLR